MFPSWLQTYRGLGIITVLLAGSTLLVTIAIRAVTSGSGCQAGYARYGPEGTCKRCGPGEWSAAGAKACTPCAPGRWSGGHGATACEACLPGRWSSKVGSTRQDTCSNCSAGTWSSLEGASTEFVCTACLAGRWSSRRGATAQGTCVECEPGKWGEEVGALDEGSCRPCPAGRWSGQRGARLEGYCTQCAAGKWSSRAGASDEDTCRWCAAGKWGDEVGATSGSSCRPCGAGRWSTAAGSTACAASTDSTAGSKEARVSADGDGAGPDVEPGGAGQGKAGAAPGRGGASAADGTSKDGTAAALSGGTRAAADGAEGAASQGPTLDAPANSSSNGNGGGASNKKLGTTVKPFATYPRLEDFLATDADPGLASAAGGQGAVVSKSAVAGGTTAAVNARHVVIEVHNATYLKLSNKEKVELGKRYAGAIASVCGLDASWVLDPDGHPGAFSLAEGEGTLEDPVLLVIGDLVTPSNPREPAAKCTLEASEVQGPIERSTRDVLREAHSGDTIAPRVGHVSVLSQEAAVLMAALAADARAARRRSSSVGATRPPSRWGLISGLLVGLGSLFMCSGALLAFIVGSGTKTKRSAAFRLCGAEDDGSASELEDSEAHPGMEAAPLLGPVEMPTPPRSPLQSPHAREARAMKGLEPPSGLEIKMDSMGVELPPLGSPAGRPPVGLVSPVLQTVPGFLQPMAGMSALQPAQPFQAKQSCRQAPSPVQSPHQASAKPAHGPPSPASFPGLQAATSFAAQACQPPVAGIAAPPSPLAPLQVAAPCSPLPQHRPLLSPHGRWAAANALEPVAPRSPTAQCRQVGRRNPRVVDVEVASWPEAQLLPPSAVLEEEQRPPPSSVLGEAIPPSAVLEQTQMVYLDAAVRPSQRAISFADQAAAPQRRAAPRRTPSSDSDSPNGGLSSRSGAGAGPSKKRPVKYELKSANAAKGDGLSTAGRPLSPTGQEQP